MLHGVPESRRKGRFGGRAPSISMQQMQIAAVIWRIERERFRLIPDYFGYLF